MHNMTKQEALDYSKLYNSMEGLSEAERKKELSKMRNKLYNYKK